MHIVYLYFPRRSSVFVKKDDFILDYYHFVLPHTLFYFLFGPLIEVISLLSWLFLSFYELHLERRAQCIRMDVSYFYMCNILTKKRASVEVVVRWLWLSLNRIQNNVKKEEKF